MDTYKSVEFAYSVGEYSNVVEQTNTFDPAWTGDTLYEIKRMRALSLFQTGRYKDAVVLWDVLLAERPEVTLNYFNKATSTAMMGDADSAVKAFDIFVNKKALENPTVADMVYMHYYFMRALMDGKKYQDAFGILKKIIPHYTFTGCTDQTFLVGSMGGFIPSFSEVVLNAIDIFSNIDKNIAQQFLSEVESKVDDEGKSVIAEVKNQI
ncbi:MAG: hypothetical protein RIT04_562 [Candidatus Parcubacteria bacterium]|jgi:tetratricopeptide (TPR) repeat protein